MKKLRFGILAIGFLSASIVTLAPAQTINPYPLINIQTAYPSSATLGAKLVACLSDVTVLPNYTCDATGAVQADSGVGTAWSISGTTLTVTMQNSVPSGDTIYLVFGSTTSLNGSYTILTRSPTTFTVATTSGLTSGTETITMYPLKNTPIEVGRNYQQNVKWPSGGTLYDQTPATTLATPSAPGLSFMATGGSFPGGQNVCATVNYRTGDGVSASWPEFCITTTTGPAGVLSITGPATCPTYAQGYDVNLTFSTVGTHDEKLQGNSACGAPLAFTRAVLYPSAGAMPTAATAVPAFILYNVNKPVFYADSGTNGAFIIRTGPSFGASNIIATGTKGYSSLANITAYNYSHVNMAGAALFDSAFFVGSTRFNVSAVGTGGTSGTPAVGYKIYGTANDVSFYSLSPSCQDTFCTPLVIQETPSTYNDSEGMGRFNFYNPTIQSTSSTSPIITMAGNGFGGNNAVVGAGLAEVNFFGGSLETTSGTGCATIQDAQNINFYAVNCTSKAFTVGSQAYAITSTAVGTATYTTNTINVESPQIQGFQTVYQNNINSDSITVPNNNYPYTGDYHYGGGQHPNDIWQSRPVISDSSIAASQLIGTGATQGLGAFGVGTGTIPTTSLPTSYVGIIGPASGTPAYFLQLPSAVPTAGQQLLFAAPTSVNGVSQAVGTWATAGTGGAATIAAGATAQIGTGGTAVCATSHLCDSLSGEITLTTGTGALSAGTLVTATFSGVTRTNPPNCLITQQGGTAISTYAKSATSTVLTISGLATASTTYVLDYGCGGN